MRYLKSYNEGSISPDGHLWPSDVDQTMENLNDIFQELRDDGYLISVERSWKYKISDLVHISVKISNISTDNSAGFRWKKPLSYNDIKDYIERAFDYMDQEGYRFTLPQISLISDTLYKDQIEQLKIFLNQQNIRELEIRFYPKYKVL